MISAGRKALIIGAVLAFSCAGAGTGAAEKPLFELRVVGGGGYLPDYPAAGQNHFNGIALPFPIYRGDFFRSDSKGLLRGRLIHGRDFELDVSLSGSLDADSDNNDARRGMPDLDHMAELGPRIQWTIARAAKAAAAEASDHAVASKQAAAAAKQALAAAAAATKRAEEEVAEAAEEAARAKDAASRCRKREAEVPKGMLLSSRSAWRK